MEEELSKLFEGHKVEMTTFDGLNRWVLDEVRRTQEMVYTSPTIGPTPIPVAVVGCGRMGKLHARVYSQMPNVKLVGVYDAVAGTAAAVAAEYKTQVIDDPRDLLPHVRAVTIAVPTVHHVGVAEPFLERGIACLIEKPLAKNSDECRRIVELASQHDAMIQVGHIERFNPALRAAEKLNIQPRFMEVMRISPMPFRSLDVGVVLDVMIHDLDIVLKLASSPVKSVDAVGVSVIGGGVEDVCNARVRFENGCVANLTASRLSLKTERKLRLAGPEGYVSIDFQKKTAALIRRDGNLESVRTAVASVSAGEIADLTKLNYADLVRVEQLEIDPIEPLRAQADAFIEAVTRRSRPVVSAADGLAAVLLAEQIVGCLTPSMDL